LWRELPLQDLTPADYQSLAEFRYQIRRFLSFSEQAARRAGLEPRQHQLMLAIKGHRTDPAIGDLAERLQLRHHSVVGLVDRLEEHRLVKRRRAAGGDRRQVAVRLTRKGDALLHKLTLDHRAEFRTAGRALVGSLQAILEQI
jgi:DNA-binding MarR family transcriptional regulator